MAAWNRIAYRAYIALGLVGVVAATVRLIFSGGPDIRPHRLSSWHLRADKDPTNWFIAGHG